MARSYRSTGSLSLLSGITGQTNHAGYFRMVLDCLRVLFPCLVCGIALGQDPAAGILPFSTQVGGQYDSIDLASSNINLIIPILNKTGKFPFKYQLVGNFHAVPQFTNGTLYYAVSAGLFKNPGLGGTPVSADLGAGAFGGTAGTQVPTPEDLGVFATYTAQYITCTINYDQTGYSEVDSGFAIVDATGATHTAYGLSVTFDEYPDEPGCPAVVDGNGTTYDGSGYTITATLNGTKSYSVAIYDRSGNVQSAGITKDPDGVQASLSTNPTTKVTTYTDSLGETVLTSTPGSVLFNNGAPDTYTYTTVNSSQQSVSQTVTVQYSKLYGKTNFGCGAYTDISPGY